MLSVSAFYLIMGACFKPWPKYSCCFSHMEISLVSIPLLSIILANNNNRY